jgi:hypothetical protein
MIVGIHQPHYLPWLRYVHKMATCDVFVLLDDVQFAKNGWQNRNRIKGPGGPVLLTVPLRDPAFKPITEVEVHSEPPWREKHWKSLLLHYGKAPFFKKYAGVFEATFATPWSRLVDLNIHLLEGLSRAFGIRTQVVRSSRVGLPGRGTERLVSLCRSLGATHYLTGAFAAGHHLDTLAFQEAGIEVHVQTWACPEYRQQFPAKGFLPELSAIDLLFNEGPDSLGLLTAGRPQMREVALNNGVFAHSTSPHEVAIGEGLREGQLISRIPPVEGETFREQAPTIRSVG